MTELTGLLYTICNALLVPVIVVLLLFLCWAAVLFGGFVREFASRRRVRRVLGKCIDAARRGEGWAAILGRMRAGPSGPARAFCRRVDGGTADPKVLEHTLTAIEHEVSGAMAKLSLLTRAGPMLGLMGTLIPLGPALMGLASGNTQALAHNLVVAFATTVIGVLVGILAFGMSLARRAWYAHDLDDIEHVCDRLAPQEARA